MRIGFIGTGVMGGSMAGHLLKAGYAVTVFNRTKTKAEDLLAAGAEWADTPAGVARNAEVVFTIVGDPSDVEAIYLGPEGILAQAEAGTLVVDMTTSSPDLAETLYQKGKEKGIEVLDAPVSGGDSGAREGTLSIMVGGDRNTFDSALQLLEILGSNIVYQGKAGNGQRTKMANQIAVAAGMLGVCEALAYATGTGLDPKTVLQSIESGAAGSWALTNLAPRILKEDYAPGFFVKHFIKDLKLAVESAENASTDLPALKLALQEYEALASEGNADKGTQALYTLYHPGNPQED